MQNLLKIVCESKKFIQILNEVFELYFKYGARSNKNINYFHNYIKDELEKIFVDKKYKVSLECKVKSTNSSGNKKCDIVVQKNNEPFIIFPVKIIKTNYKQNKNNFWENLTGELMHITWANQNIKIIPINIFMNLTPYLDSFGKITKFEHVSFNDITNYDILKEKNLVYDIINYIFDVEHLVNINEKFTKLPIILHFNYKTKFRCLDEIVNNLL